LPEAAVYEGRITVKLPELYSNLFYKLTYKFRNARIVVNQVKLSGDNSFVDIRYWLSRPDKVQGNSQIYLVDEASKQKLELMNLPKFGSLCSKHSKYQSLGILLFYNKNNVINHDSQITLHFGCLIAKNIKVT
jgi:hypothetical protein